MPIYDFKCSSCDATRSDVFTKSWEELIYCTSCGQVMKKTPSIFVADTFPSDGIHLEHVCPEGKTFHSKQEMRKYAKDNDLELGAL